MKTWTERPSKADVERFLAGFFALLRAGQLDQARDEVTHAYPDWDETLYTTWQDHYLIHETPRDTSFEGALWKSDPGWLRDLTTRDSIEWINDDTCWVDFVYRGEASGYIGEFAVKPGDGGWHVERVAFRMA